MSQNQQQVANVENPFIGESMVKDNAIVFTGKVGKYMIKKKPILSSFWCLGLFLLFFVSGFVVPQEKLQKYEQQQDQLGEEYTKVFKAKAKLDQVYTKYYNSKGYFFQCDSFCTRNWEKYQAEKQVYDSVEKQQKNKENEMRQYVGLYSSHGVQESKDMYWTINKEGRQSAKNVSYFDTFFTMISVAFNNDNSIYEALFQLVIQIIWNYFLFNIISTIRFCWNIVWLVLDYSPNPIEGGIFLVLAIIAALSWFMIYNYILFLLGRGTVTTAISLSNNERLEAQQRSQTRRIYQQQQQQQYQQQNQHYHQE